MSVGKLKSVILRSNVALQLPIVFAWRWAAARAFFGALAAERTRSTATGDMRATFLCSALLLSVCAHPQPSLPLGVEALASARALTIRFPPATDSLGWPVTAPLRGHAWTFGDAAGQHVASFGIDGGDPNAGRATGSLERVVRHSTLRSCNPPPWHPFMVCARDLEGRARVDNGVVVLVISDTAFLRRLLRDRPARFWRSVAVNGIRQAFDSVTVRY